MRRHHRYHNNYNQKRGSIGKVIIVLLVLLLIFVIAYYNGLFSESGLRSHIGIDIGQINSRQTQESSLVLSTCTSQIQGQLNILQSKLPPSDNAYVVNTTLFYGNGTYMGTNLSLITIGGQNFDTVKTNYSVPINNWIKTWTNLPQAFGQNINCYKNYTLDNAYICVDLRTVAVESESSNSSGIYTVGEVVKISSSVAAYDVPLICGNSGNLLNNSKEAIVTGAGVLG